MPCIGWGIQNSIQLGDERRGWSGGVALARSPSPLVAPGSFHPVSGSDAKAVAGSRGTYLCNREDIVSLANRFSKDQFDQRKSFPS